MSEEKFTPDGGATEWSDEEIETMAEITAAKIAEARADARRYPELWDFLNAPEAE